MHTPNEVWSVYLTAGRADPNHQVVVDPVVETTAAEITPQAVHQPQQRTVLLWTQVAPRSVAEKPVRCPSLVPQVLLV